MQVTKIHKRVINHPEEMTSNYYKMDFLSLDGFTML